MFRGGWDRIEDEDEDGDDDKDEDNWNLMYLIFSQTWKTGGMISNACKAAVLLQIRHLTYLGLHWAQKRISLGL